MYDVQLHETVMTVSPTSRYNAKFDIVHVETIIKTAQPIPSEDIFFVPSMDKVPSHILEILELGGFCFEPIPMSEVTRQISNFEQAVKNGTKEETLADAMVGLGAKFMKQVKMTPIGDNFYRISYDFALMPEDDGSFVIQTTLPHKGFNMPRAGQVRFIVVLPTNAKCDRDATKGEVEGSHQIIDEPTPPNVANGRQVVSFFYQNDPKFTVKYKY